MRQVTIKGISIGDGTVKICVPLAGENAQVLLDEAAYIQELPCELVEWRADLWEHGHNPERLKEMLLEIRRILPEKPLLFTYRTKDEGGRGTATPERYVAICKHAIDSELVDMVDVEFIKAETFAAPVLTAAKARGIKILLSYHSFAPKVPERESLIRLLLKQQRIGADIAKVAVMTENPEDADGILDAMEQAYQRMEIPFVLIGMGIFGGITRALVPFRGSSLTYASGKSATAPGQRKAEELLAERDCYHV